MRLTLIAALSLAACDGATEATAIEAADTDTDTDADTDADTDTDTDADTDTDTDTDTDFTACDGVVDLGGTAAVGTGAVQVMMDARQAIYQFSAGTTERASLDSPAGAESEEGGVFTVAYPADRWVITATADGSTEYFPTLHTGWGVPAVAPQIRLFHRADLETRFDLATWSIDPAKGLAGVYAFDSITGAPITGATVSLGDATYGHAFIWELATLGYDPETGAELQGHLPVDHDSQLTQGGAMYYSDVCPGMTEVTVDAGCGPCWLGDGGPTAAYMAIDADTMSLSWWTCETNCE